MSSTPAAATNRRHAFDAVEIPIEPTGMVLALRGELDLATAPPLRERLDAIVKAGTTRLVLDLRGVTFMDSVALAVVLHGRRALGDDGRMGIVVADGSYIRLLFETAGLPPCLDIFGCLEDATAHVTR
jgi:anti-sigma B factor antagonist